MTYTSLICMWLLGLQPGPDVSPAAGLRAVVYPEDVAHWAGAENFRARVSAARAE